MGPRVVTVLASGLIAWATLAAQQGLPPATVITAPAVEEPITETITLPGTVSPLLDSLVASEVAGRVARRRVENGQSVHRNQILVQLDDSRLQQQLSVARAEKTEVDAQLELARLDQRRAEELFVDGVLPERDRDAARTTREALDARRQALDARIASIEDDIERARIRAPFGGVITELHVEIGEWVDPGDEVVRLSDLDTLEIRLEVPERYFSFLRSGAPAMVRVDALPQLELDAEVFSLVPRADSDARTLPVMVRGKNPDRRVAAGMLCTVELTLSSDDRALLVPKDALVRQAQRQVVFVIEDGAARLVPVTIGRGSGDRVEVFGELRAGDAVVIRGNERLIPGQPVREGAPAGTTAASD